ncbi:MAG: antibiotic biosynthesis monooxygenase [Desulfobacteraceae bacterium]|jgi:heme-degrading monooxygenase HmoA|nr:MAG: antibiotic biosynthesis monooxygenase [Desulfobacteraceae bacterium]
MIVRVLMIRKLAMHVKGLDGEILPHLSDLLVELRTLANHQPGYISGETLRNVSDPDEYLVISTWKSLGAWQRWFANQKRAELEGKVDALLGSSTVYKVFSYDL